MTSIALILGNWMLLASEAKGKSSAVRTSVEKAQQSAKTCDQNDQITPDSPNQGLFTAPFILAVESGYEKLISASLLPIARLAGSLALSSDQISTLLCVLSTFNLLAQNVETQLKILQLLPLVMQNYGSVQLHFLQIVKLLASLANSSSPVVSNAASATLQQIFSSLYDQLKDHVHNSSDHKIVKISFLEDEKSEPLSLDQLEYSCYGSFLDLCSAVVSKTAEFFDNVSISKLAALENIENVILLHSPVFHTHPELAGLLRTKAVPVLLNTLSSTSATAYPLVVRSLRVVNLLATRQLPRMEVEIEIIFLYANHIILNSSSHSSTSTSNVQNMVFSHWEQVLVFELYRLIFSNFSNIKALFEAYDIVSQKKDVLKEILSVLKTYLVNTYSAMISQSDLVVPIKSTACLTKNNSNLNVSLLDNLEKSDPPSTLPEFYVPNLLLSVLIELSDGVAEFVASMSLHVDLEMLEGEVEFITQLNTALFMEIYQLFDVFLHFSMSADCFIDLVAALQRYTHAVGLLGLGQFRDQLLKLLALCVYANMSPEPSISDSSGSSKLLSIGESIVESINSTIIAQHADKKQISSPSNSKSRVFNSRLIVCLGALLNLATCLGTTLGSLWRIIWITLQWVEYFLNGPDGFSGYNQSDAKIGHPTLSSSDLAEIRTMKQNGYLSILQYQESTVLEVMEVLKELFVENGAPDYDASCGLQPCPFNRSFYVEQMARLSQLDYSEFIFYQSDARSFISAFLVDAATDRTLAPSFRLLLSNSYATFVQSVTCRGFRVAAADRDLPRAFLHDLQTFLDALLELETPSEYMVANCEAEIHLLVLSTLHDQINEYDAQYCHYWSSVFTILNTVFMPTVPKGSDHKLEDRIRLLIAMSFGTLKMILDEFLSSLAAEYVQALIDTLLNFCQQKYDLNISFSSVSYFWLISDSINTTTEDNIAIEPVSWVAPPVFENVAELEALLASSNESHSVMLNTYLLARLAVVATDSRSQVREGAIQTLFQILDVQGKKLQSWESILHIVFPLLLEWGYLRPDSPAGVRKDIMVSLTLVLSNMVLIYSKFMMNFEREPRITKQFWTQLLDFLSRMLRLRWCDLSSKVFQTFLDLLFCFSEESNIPLEIREKLYEFWANAPIEYDFVDLAYQDSLVAYVDGFRRLLPLFRLLPEAFPAAQVMSNLNKCARYPILKPNQSDSKKPTALQKAALDGLVAIGTELSRKDVDANVAQQLAHVAAYPFETRARIVAKLSSMFGGRLQIPSFIAVSLQAFFLLVQTLGKIEAVQTLFAEQRMHKILKSLLFLVHNRAPGTILAEHDSSEFFKPDASAAGPVKVYGTGSKPLWVQANDIIFQVLHRALDECPSALLQANIWDVVLETITVNFEDREENEEKYSVMQYEKLSKKLVPALLQSSSTGQIELFVKTLYAQSFMYEWTEEEKDFRKGSEPLNGNFGRNTFLALCNYNFSSGFGTTAPMAKKNNQRIRLMCLEELFRFAGLEGGKDLLLERVAFSLRRFVADSMLLRLRPVVRLQQIEMCVILGGLVKLRQELDPGLWTDLRRLLSRCILFSHRVNGMSELLEELLLPE